MRCGRSKKSGTGQYTQKLRRKCELRRGKEDFRKGLNKGNERDDSEICKGLCIIYVQGEFFFLELDLIGRVLPPCEIKR